MTKLNQGDTVHIEVIVEHDYPHEVGVLVKNPAETRVRLPKTLVKFHQRGPIKTGDKVFKGTGKTRKEGVVKHRDGDMAWVSFGDTQSVETVEALTLV